MEKFTFSHNPSGKNKRDNFPLTKHLLSYRLICSARLFSSLNGQCPAMISVFPSIVACQGHNMFLTSTVVGTTYTFTASCNARMITGITNSKTVNINQSLTNTGTIIGTIRYIIVPTRNGCPGIPTNVDVNVQLMSYTVAVRLTQTICFGSQNAAIILTSNVPGTSILW